MDYQKQTFVSGQVLTATAMNHIEDGLSRAAQAINERVGIEGSRGVLAGYEVPNVTASDVVIDGDSADTIQTMGAVSVTVGTGEANTTFTKVVAIADATSTVTLGDAWTWVGGEAPELVANSIVILKWCGAFGLANVLAGE